MRNSVQARGVQHGDALPTPPFMDRRSSESEGAGDGSMIAVKVLEDVYGSHTRESTVVDIYVNPRRPNKVFSVERASTLVYGAMENKNRRRLNKPFNGEVIRTLREGRNMSQERLAELVGTTKANISKWERSRIYIAISHDLFFGLAKALYVAPEILVRKLSEPATPGPSAPAMPTPRKRR